MDNETLWPFLLFHRINNFSLTNKIYKITLFTKSTKTQFIPTKVNHKLNRIKHNEYPILFILIHLSE